MLLILRGGLFMSIDDFPEVLSQTIVVVGIILVGRLAAESFPATWEQAGTSGQGGECTDLQLPCPGQRWASARSSENDVRDAEAARRRVRHHGLPQPGRAWSAAPFHRVCPLV